MADQTITKPVGLIKDFKIYIHGIPYIAMFVVMKNNVYNSNYSMLLGRPWLHNAFVTHDWGNNLITIEGNGTMQTIVVTKHLDNNIKRPKVFLCYDVMEGIINDEEKILFIAKPNLFTFQTITLLESKIFNVAIFGAEVGIGDFTFNFPHFK
jgi:hypothetical protein